MIQRIYPVGVGECRDPKGPNGSSKMAHYVERKSFAKMAPLFNDT